MNGVLTIVGAVPLMATKGRAPAKVVVRNGLIAEATATGERAADRGGRTIDAGGLLLAPGLIDVQLNGGFGADFTTEPEAIWQVGERLPALGVTAFLPTIVSAPRAARDAACRVIAARSPAGYLGAMPLGLHFEGPFLSPAAAGVHDPDALRMPGSRDVGAEAWSVEAGTRLVTIAPELPGALALIAELVARGVRVSVGHSAADFDQATAAFDAGATYATHLFNAMPPLHHRQPGLAGAALDDRRVSVGLIADGVHTHAAIVRLVATAVGPQRVSLVTDATAALGLPSGGVTLAGRELLVDETSVRLAEDGRLAGSALAADEGLRRFRAMSGWSAADAIATMTTVPARLLGLADRGVLRPGARADLVLFTADLEVIATFVGGLAVHGPWA